MVWFHSLKALSATPKNSESEEFPFKVVSITIIYYLPNDEKSRLYRIR